MNHTRVQGARRQGDRYLHPYERTLTIRRRQADGTYAEVVLTGGTVEPASLPGVAIDLDELFAG